MPEFHAELSPSKRHRWGVCPGSIREEAKYPEQASGPAALDGTRSHEILEYCIKAGLIGPLHLIGTTRTDAHGSYVVDADRANRVNLAIEYIRSRSGYPGAMNAIAEQRVYPDGFLQRSDCSGTVDCQIPGDDVYEIIDYKDGMAPVSAENNHQLELYALGALAGLAEPYPKTVRMTIIQPKLAFGGKSAISSYDVPTAELLAKVEGIQAEAAATDEPNAPLVPGEAQCKYCRAKGACPALAGKVMSEVNMLFPVVATSLDVAHQAAAKDPTMMDDAQLRQILEVAPLVRQLIEGVEAEVLRRLNAGQAFPGFKLVAGRGSRGWALPDDEMAKKLKGMGVPQTSIFETKLISPAKAEKLVWDKKGTQTKLSENQLKRMQTEYVASQPGKLTVAPESDPRKEVVINAAPMFGAIEPALPDWLAVPDWLK